MTSTVIFLGIPQILVIDDPLGKGLNYSHKIGLGIWNVYSAYGSIQTRTPIPIEVVVKISRDMSWVWFFFLYSVLFNPFSLYVGSSQDQL